MESLRNLLAVVVARIGLVAALWYVGLYVIGFAILQPEYLADQRRVVGFFDDYTTVKVGSWALALSVAGLVWFLGSMTGDLRAAGEERLARIAIGGGLVAASAVAAGASVLWVGTSRLEAAGPAGVDPSALSGLHDLANALLFVAAPFGFGVAVLAAAAAGARAGRVPSVVTAVAALLAVALWVPWISRFALWGWLAWVVLVAVMHERRVDAARA